jgi:hypothetical protein
MYYFLLKAQALVDTLLAYEQKQDVQPIDEDHEVYVLQEVFVKLLPGGNMPVEGRRRWHALLGASCEKSADAMNHAGDLADWITNEYLHVNRLIIELETGSLVLDGDLYVGLDPTALAVVAYLQRKGRLVSSRELQANVPGCNRDEKQIRRCLERLQKKLNYRCGASTRGLPTLNLVKSAPGRGSWLELPLNSKWNKGLRCPKVPASAH